MKTEDQNCFYFARNVHTHSLTSLCVHASAGMYLACAVLVWLWGERVCVCWFTVRRGAAPLRDRGMWMGQDVCCSVRASPLLRLLNICQVACRLEWCIAAKTQWGIRRRHGSPPGKGPRVRSSSDDPKIRRSFPGEKPLSPHQRIYSEDAFILFLKAFVYLCFYCKQNGAVCVCVCVYIHQIHHKTTKYVTVSFCYLQFAVRNRPTCLRCSIIWVQDNRNYRIIDFIVIIWVSSAPPPPHEMHWDGLVLLADGAADGQRHRAHPEGHSQRQSQEVTGTSVLVGYGPFSSHRDRHRASRKQAGPSDPSQLFVKWRTQSNTWLFAATRQVWVHRLSKVEWTAVTPSCAVTCTSSFIISVTDCQR